MSDRRFSANGLAVYVLQGRYGVAFTRNDGLLRPTGLADRSPIEFEEAAAEIGLEVACSFGQPEEYCDRAKKLFDAGDLDGALAEAQRAIARNNKVPAGYRWRAIVRGTQGDLVSAITDFTTAINLDSSHAVTWDSRGITIAKMGNAADAYRDFDTAINLDPSYPNSYRHRAMAARLLGLFEQAEVDEHKYEELTRQTSRRGGSVTS